VEADLPFGGLGLEIRGRVPKLQRHSLALPVRLPKVKYLP
jgi:hypothetical protein